MRGSSLFDDDGLVALDIEGVTKEEEDQLPLLEARHRWVIKHRRWNVDLADRLSFLVQEPGISEHFDHLDPPAHVVDLALFLLLSRLDHSAHEDVLRRRLFGKRPQSAVGGRSWCADGAHRTGDDHTDDKAAQRTIHGVGSFAPVVNRYMLSSLQRRRTNVCHQTGAPAISQLHSPASASGTIAFFGMMSSSCSSIPYNVTKIAAVAYFTFPKTP
jgi:hypothetical protein